jgi:hypothetical protein
MKKCRSPTLLKQGTKSRSVGRPVLVMYCKWQHAQVKQTLDDTILDHLSKTFGYEQDFSGENKKLLMMLACCAFALAAQFYPKPFPESRVILGNSGYLYYVTTSPCLFRFLNCR